MINPEALQWNITKETPPDDRQSILAWWAEAGHITMHFYLKSRDKGERPDLWMPIRADLAKERWEDYVRTTTSTLTPED